MRQINLSMLSSFHVFSINRKTDFSNVVNITEIFLIDLSRSPIWQKVYDLFVYLQPVGTSSCDWLDLWPRLDKGARLRTLRARTAFQGTIFARKFEIFWNMHCQNFQNVYCFNLRRHFRTIFSTGKTFGWQLLLSLLKHSQLFGYSPYVFKRM